MAKVIEIEVPVEEIVAREERVTKTKRFETPDRVAIIPAINYRYLLPVILWRWGQASEGVVWRLRVAFAGRLRHSWARIA